MPQRFGTNEVGYDAQRLRTALLANASGDAGGERGAPSDEQYLVLALSTMLSEERRFTHDTTLQHTDGGANADYDLGIADEILAELGLLNQIYVWHSDGSALEHFDPDEDGLNAALTAASSGDTVWLPSVTIALSAGILIPPGVAVVGISELSTISASGFSGAAITMSDNSICYGFTVTMTSNGTDAIGIDAHASGVRVDHMIVNVSGGSSVNSSATTGDPITASEIWFSDTSGNIYWRTIAGTWSKITAPVNPTTFMIAPDGSVVAIANDTYVYACTNPKAGTPTWTLLHTVGDTVLGYATIDLQAINVRPGGIVCVGVQLDYPGNTHAAGAYGESINGGAVTWSGPFIDNVYTGGGFVVGVAYDALIMSFGGGPQVTQRERFYKTGSHSARYDHTYAYYCNSVWRNLIDDITLTERTTGWLNITTGAQSSIWATNNGHQYDTITGAWLGNFWYTVDYNGTLYTSTDSSTWSQIATWAQGWVHDKIYNGGGALIWLRKSTSASGTVIREYASDGGSYSDLTSNLWSLTSGTLTTAGLGLVYT